jgi:hypothetical protein
VKRIVTIFLVGFFLQAGVAHALTECFKRAHNAHKQTNWDAHGYQAEDDPPAANIHCTNPQLQFGLTVSPTQQNLSKRSVKKLVPLWAGTIMPLAANAGAAPPIISRIDSNFYPHASTYLFLSVLRI